MKLLQEAVRFAVDRLGAAFGTETLHMDGRLESDHVGGFDDFGCRRASRSIRMRSATRYGAANRKEGGPRMTRSRWSVTSPRRRDEK